MRWLSYRQAVQTMIKFLVPLCTFLEEETEERSCAKASGILNNLRNWRTVLILQMLSCLTVISRSQQTVSGKIIIILELTIKSHIENLFLYDDDSVKF